MCSMSVLCPLCAVPSFGSLEQLQQRLIKAANGPLACPFPQCAEQFLGLDKLTIHLFTHTSLMTSDTEKSTVTITADKQQQQQQLEAQAAVTATKRKVKKVKPQKNAIKPSELQLPTAIAATRLTLSHQQVQPQELSTAAAASMSTVTCDICEFTFRNAELRDMHFHLVHENLENASALNLNSISNKPNLADEPFKCHLCAKTFKMKGSLRVHLKVVHLVGLPYLNNVPKLNICDRIRYKEASTTVTITTTTTTTTTTTATATASAAATTTINLNALSNGTIALLTSAKSSNTTTSLLNISANDEIIQNAGNALNSNVMVVYNTNVPIATSQSQSQLQRQPLLLSIAEMEAKDKMPIADVNPKIWECDVCAKSFTTKYFLKKHKRLHTGEMPYTCEICARTFTFQQSYHKHLLYHSEVKPHMCTVCGRAFKELSTLHNHERIHSGEKPFKCEVCGKSFRQRVSFLVHMRIHTGIMPYKCAQCQKSFRYKVSQRTHKCTASAHDTGAEQLADSFIRTLLENNASNTLTESQHSPASTEIAAIDDGKCHIDVKATMAAEEALLTKTIDDIVVESCQKLGLDYGQDLVAPSSTIVDDNSSPLQKLQNLRIYSPQLLITDPAGTNEDIMYGEFMLNECGTNLL